MEKLKDSIQGIYRYDAYFGRQGDLEGLFISNEVEINEIIGKEVYFGEVLGKHSDVSAYIAEDEITLVSDDQMFIKKFIEIMGGGTISGYNPVDYYKDQEEM